jgi:hypothetical protein
MTLFRFDELTWPEIAALPHATPLVLPLGNLPDLATVAMVLQTSQPVLYFISRR